MRRAITILALSSMLTGCVTANFTEPVAKFTTAMSTANKTIATYFTGMNAYQRKVYLTGALYDPTIEVSAPYNGPSNGLLPYFSASSVKARLDALSLLTAYGERLAAIAGSKAPERFQAGSAVLGTNLTQLSDRFRALAAGSEPDATAKNYAEPISAIVGAFGQLALEKKRDAAFRKAVNQAAPEVNTVLKQLDEDLAKVVDPLIEVGELRKLSKAMLFYNQNRGTLSFEQRAALLDQIDSLAAGYQAAVTADPSEAIDGIRDAHAALVQYANSSRTPKDLAALVSAIETFNNRLEPVVNAVNKLRS